MSDTNVTRRVMSAILSAVTVSLMMLGHQLAGITFVVGWAVGVLSCMTFDGDDL